jgi:O-antigen/teichoic acid export membrane protein
MLVSLTSNLPRYAVEAFLGTRELGAFAAVAVLLNAGSTVANALGQAATPRLARAYISRDLAGFRLLAAKLAGLTLLVGAAGVLFAARAGRGFLRLAYSADYVTHAGLLVTVMVAGIFVYVAVLLGYVVTSARSFLSQMPLLALVAVTSAGASWLLVPSMGLAGAAVAVALAACLQIGGQLLILSRALRRAEAA